MYQYATLVATNPLGMPSTREHTAVNRTSFGFRHGHGESINKSYPHSHAVIRDGVSVQFFSELEIRGQFAIGTAEGAQNIYLGEIAVPWHLSG